MMAGKNRKIMIKKMIQQTNKVCTKAFQEKKRHLQHQQSKSQTTIMALQTSSGQQWDPDCKIIFAMQPRGSNQTDAGQENFGFHIFMLIIEILFCCWYNTLNIQYTISGSNFFLGKWCWASFNTLLSSQLHQFGWVAGRTRLFMWCVIADRTEKGMSGCVCYMQYGGRGVVVVSLPDKVARQPQQPTSLSYSCAPVMNILHQVLMLMSRSLSMMWMSKMAMEAPGRG